MRLPGIEQYRRSAFNQIPGWMHALDLDLFDRILAHQLDADITGDMLEIGSYHGKSAIALGYGLRDGETLTVCDLFGADVEGVPSEGIDAYEGLSVNDFQASYRRFHRHEPIIHACPSSMLNLTDQQFRFAHIDGGHAYDVVRDDIALVHKHALKCVVALDDYRSVHTPGVSAALWEAVAHGMLFPFLLSEVKVYATTSQAAQYFWFSTAQQFSGLASEVHTMHGYDVLRVWY